MRNDEDRLYTFSVSIAHTYHSMEWTPSLTHTHTKTHTHTLTLIHFIYFRDRNLLLVRFYIWNSFWLFGVCGATRCARFDCVKEKKKKTIREYDMNAIIGALAFKIVHSSICGGGGGNEHETIFSLCIWIGCDGTMWRVCYRVNGNFIAFYYLIISFLLFLCCCCCCCCCPCYFFFFSIIFTVFSVRFFKQIMKLWSENAFVFTSV